MTESDKYRFFSYLSDVLAFYEKPSSEFALQAWWTILQRFEFAAIQSALNAHIGDPDVGRWCPKPGDIVQKLEGGRQDAAALAWGKVDHAVRTIGNYQSVVFDDPIIHAAIEDIGGWVALGRVDNDEWPFVAQRFQRQYQAYKGRGSLPAYLPKLVGLCEIQNQQNGIAKSQPPLMIGDASRCQQVYLAGSDSPRGVPQKLPLDAVLQRLESQQRLVEKKAG